MAHLQVCPRKIRRGEDGLLKLSASAETRFIDCPRCSKCRMMMNRFQIESDFPPAPEAFWPDGNRADADKETIRSNPEVQRDGGNETDDVMCFYRHGDGWFLGHSVDPDSCLDDVEYGFQLEPVDIFQLATTVALVQYGPWVVEYDVRLDESNCLLWERPYLHSKGAQDVKGGFARRVLWYEPPEGQPADREVAMGYVERLEAYLRELAEEDAD